MATKNLVPMHVAIIADGNRRWAVEKGLAPTIGHEKAVNKENLTSLADEAMSLGIKYLSFWIFSTENWNRSSFEVNALMKLFLKWTQDVKKDLIERKIRFVHLGRKDRIPKELADKLSELEEETKHFVEFTVIACIDYGGRDEIIRAVNRAIQSRAEKVDENSFKQFLDTKDIPDPDLIIRTSGEQRTSGFMPFQGIYAEWYFPKVYFPDFDALELRKAVEEFKRRNRRFGGN
jgi:undecaprenyl diphosphate synthase